MKFIDGMMYCICVSEPEMIRRTASSDSNTGDGNVVTHYHGQSTEITGTYNYYYLSAGIRSTV